MARTTPERAPLKPGSGPGPRTVYRANARRKRRGSTRARRIVVLAVVALVALFAIRALTIQGSVAPGVSVHGVDIGGLSPDDAKRKLREELVPQLDREVAVTLDQQKADMNPAKLDTRIDVTRTVDVAMQTGRLASLLMPLVYANDIAPTILTPARPRIPANLRIVAAPPRDARVRIENGKVTISPARSGHSISPRQILLATAQAALDDRRRLVLRSKVTQPAVSTAQAKAAASAAVQAANAPIAIDVDGNRVGALSTAVLQNAVMVRRDGDKAVIAFSPKVLQPALTEVLGNRIREPVNAMWDTDGRKAWVIPAKEGITFDPKQAAEAVRAAAVGDGIRQADVALERTPPRRTTADAEKFGITTKISGAETQLGDSSANRIHNVALMAEILDNRLVMPGDQFSFNDAVGPRTTDRGFLEGSAIVDGMLLPSIGGGVCQVASTLFEAVYYAGLEVDERHNHDFYISHYPLGLDATVAWSDLDFRFTNNTSHPILIRATADNSTMLVNLYSAPSDGRTVETDTSERYAVTPAEKRYIIDKYAAPGSVAIYTDGQDGFAIDVHRVVTKDGEVLSDNTFVSTYAPQPKTYIAAPDANLPGDSEIQQPPYGWVSPNDPSQTPYTG